MSKQTRESLMKDAYEAGCLANPWIAPVIPEGVNVTKKELDAEYSKGLKEYSKIDHESEYEDI